MLKVQFGCGLSNPSGWKNYDSTPTLLIKKIPTSVQLAKVAHRVVGKRLPRISQNLNNVIANKALYGDIVKGLPYQDGTVDLLYASLVLEHLPLKEFRIALQECRRLLKPGGTFRAVVPNLRFFIDEYLASSSRTKSIDFCLNTCMGTESHPNPLTRLRSADTHHIMYDTETMLNELKDAGFSSVREAFYGDSAEKEFAEVETEVSWQYPLNIGFECIN
jgi:predicted SAM-dependent methyltransferase